MTPNTAAQVLAENVIVYGNSIFIAELNRWIDCQGRTPVQVVAVELVKALEREREMTLAMAGFKYRSAWKKHLSERATKTPT